MAEISDRRDRVAALESRWRRLGDKLDRVIAEHVAELTQELSADFMMAG